MAVLLYMVLPPQSDIYHDVSVDNELRLESGHRGNRPLYFGRNQYSHSNLDRGRAYVGVVLAFVGVRGNACAVYDMAYNSFVYAVYVAMDTSYLRNLLWEKSDTPSPTS